MLEKLSLVQEFAAGSEGKEFTFNAVYQGSIPGMGRCPGERNGYPLQYSGLENSMDCIVQGVAKSQTQLSKFHFQSIARGHIPVGKRQRIP